MKRQENSMSFKKRVTIGTGRKFELSEILSSLLLLSILVFKSVFGANSGFSIVCSASSKEFKTGTGETLMEDINLAKCKVKWHLLAGGR